MKNYGFLLIDIDNTLLDFTAAERCAITKLFNSFGITADDLLISDYSAFNDSLWKRLERGEITRDELIKRRFCDFFSLHGISCDGNEAANRYFVYLSENGQVIDGAIEFLSYCKGKIPVYAVSNGVERVQYPRIKASGTGHLFDGIFLSGEAGAEKPDTAFFDYASSRIPGFEKDKAVIVGDSLTSDIAGGINYGIDTCLYNPSGKKNNTAVQPTYEVAKLSDLYNILFR